MTKPPESILVAADLSPCSMAALRYASTLARALGARLDVLHVWTEQVAYPDAMVSAGPPEAAVERLGREVRRAFDTFLEEAKASGAEIDGTLLVSGSPADTVVSTSRAYDLVVAGTHGRTGLARMLLGSVAEQIVRHSPVPVLMVRTPPAN